MFATRESWESNTEALDPAVRRLLGTNDSALVYDVPPFYPNQFVLISAKVFVSNDIDQIVTMMSFSLPKDPQELLNTAKIYFPTAIGYYYTADKTLVYIDETGKLAEIGLTESQIADMQTLQSLSSQKKIQETTGLDAQPAYAYVQPVGGLKTSLVLEMPRKILDAQIQSLARVNLLLIGISVLIIGALVYLGTTSIVRPLVRLANNAKSFAGGDWSERARVNRNDEIGLLANSFNEMVEQLSVLYRSMELKVEERTSQLRTASEVAQVATSVTSQAEMAEKAASLIKDRFGYYYVAVYLMDATASYAILRSVACDDAEFRDLVGYRIPVNSQTMIGWVASHGQSQVSLDISPTEAIEQGRNIMPLSRSAMAVPIVVGNQVLGIVEVQSTKPNDFDPDAISVFQTMADQIATGFRNVSLLESAQVNLDEVGLLYRSSRQIAQAKDEREVLENLSEALSHSQYVSIVLEAAEDHLVIRSIHDPKGTGFDSTLRGVALPVRQGLGRLSETPILLIDDLRTSSEFENLLTFLARRECRTAALIPVLMDGKPNKVIAIGSREGTALSANVLQPYSSIAEVAGSTLGRLNLVRSLSARLSDIESIADFSQAISTETDLSRLYKVLHDQAIKTFGGDIFFLVAL
ncbi:MAG TPA: GAF domain-containing protein, partial [Anaerolineaceae bacterium]|nr:GAF domain-containing protein [Anaerolineaceae bacterium]